MSGMLSQEQPHPFVSTTMKQQHISRPATEEERIRIIEFLQREYYKREKGFEVDDPEHLEQVLDEDWPMEGDFTSIENVVNTCTVTTYPNFLADNDLIEFLIWPFDKLHQDYFRSALQQFKHFRDGTLKRCTTHTDTHIPPLNETFTASVSG